MATTIDLLLQMHFLDETKLFSIVSGLYKAKEDSIHITQELSEILTGKTAVRSEFSCIGTTCVDFARTSHRSHRLIYLNILLLNSS